MDSNIHNCQLLVSLLITQQYNIYDACYCVRFYLPYRLDYSLIKAGDFYNVDQNNDHNNILDALWCQSANTGSNIGVWYYPNGNEVPSFDGDFTDSSAPSPVFSKRFSGQIALARRAGL